MSESNITFCITSSGRPTLLCDTLHSFLTLNKYPIAKYIMSEDSGNEYYSSECIAIAANLLKEEKAEKDFIKKFYKRGQSACIDDMYSRVTTPYIFHCEDDWNFDPTANANFIKDSIKILEARQDIHQVWIRHRFNHGHPMKAMETINGVMCSEMEKNFLGSWNGFTWNPGVRRLSDYKTMFPKGYNAHYNEETGSEQACSIAANSQNFKAVSLIDTCCSHTGAEHHTTNYHW